MKNWFQFVQERFSLLKHVPLIVFFVGANAFIAHGFFNQIALAFLVVLLAFFRLRVFDEIKDYETDLVVHPERPLARGLISVREAKNVAYGLILVELVLSWFIGLSAFLAAGCVVIYSLLMYKEFFIGSWLRPKMATYALTHTIISGWMALFIFSSMTGKNFWEIHEPFALFVVANWMVFNVFEFGRKTFGQEEETPRVESYSKKFGSWGSALLVLGFAGTAEFCVRTSLWVLAPLVPLLIAAIFYGASHSAIWAKRFRNACSLFILTYYMIISLGFFL